MFPGKRFLKKGLAGTNKMKKYQENGAVIVLVTAAACILFMFSGGIRTNFGIIVQTLSDRTGVSYADVSFAIVAVFILLLPKTIFYVFLFIIILGMTGDATVTPTSEIISRRFGPESLGLLFGITYVCHQTGAFISSWLGGIFITNSGNYQAIWLFDIILCTIACAASFSIRKERP